MDYTIKVSGENPFTEQAEIKNIGLEWDSIDGKFVTNNKETYDKALKVVEFYNMPYKLMTSAHRKLRDQVAEKFNFDIEVKRVGNVLHFINTNDLGSITKIKEYIRSKGFTVGSTHNSLRIEVNIF